MRQTRVQETIFLLNFVSRTSRFQIKVLKSDWLRLHLSLSSEDDGDGKNMAVLWMEGVETRGWRTIFIQGAGMKEGGACGCVSIALWDPEMQPTTCSSPTMLIESPAGLHASNCIPCGEKLCTRGCVILMSLLPRGKCSGKIFRVHHHVGEARRKVN